MMNFAKATKETPVFAKINLYDTPKAYRSDDEKPYIKGMTVAVTGTSDEDWVTYVHMSILDNGLRVGESTPYRTAGGFGDYLNKDINDFDFEIIGATDDLNGLYNKFVELHNNAPYRVHATLYSDIPIYSSYDKYQMFPHYDSVQSKMWELKDCKLNDGSDIKSIDGAIKWMLENHPSYVQGMCIAQDCPSGNFYCAAVPSEEYGVGNFETYDNRYDYACQWASQLGVVAGDREF